MHFYSSALNSIQISAVFPPECFVHYCLMDNFKLHQCLRVCKYLAIFLPRRDMVLGPF